MTVICTKSADHLAPGDHHYKAFVGPPEKYDLLAAHQFELLTQLGLREHHRLLDIGCGSLRAGRLFIVYLDCGNYFGIEPEAWLLTDGISAHLGEDALALKRPSFSHATDFNVAVFKQQFDFVLAQSIFSHASLQQIEQCMANVVGSIHREGLFAATFVLGKDDYAEDAWVYPGCVEYRPSTIRRLASSVGFYSAMLRAGHPNNQQWFVFTKDQGIAKRMDGLWIGRAATEELARRSQQFPRRVYRSLGRILRGRQR